MRLTIGYDGTDFFGSQIQPSARTVQGDLERALARVTGQRVGSTFAGRTDRGVHAAAQVVSAQVPWRAGADALRRALNSELSDDVVVADVVEASPDFHARFDAKWREYRYTIVESAARPVLHQRYAWWRRDRLDADRARMGARYLVGDQLFGSFAGAGASQQLPDESLRRTVYVCEWREMNVPWPVGEGSMRWHELRVVASGFLPNMVRNIAAAVVDVARGHREPEWVQSVVGANDRRELDCAPAPPQGLLLWQVGYSEFDSPPSRNR